MILLADSTVPDQIVHGQFDLGLCCPYMPKDKFSHGAAHILVQLNLNGLNIFGTMEIHSRQW